MRWRGRQGSSNVEDRRGRGGRGGRRAGGITLGTIIIAVIFLIMGKDPMQVLQQLQSTAYEQPAQTQVSDPNDEMGKFVSVVLKETEIVWDRLFREQLGKTYRQPKLVLFSGQVSSACGYASSATGPFYCPGDEKVYIDLSFYNDLKNRFGAPGDFAMAYVIAHEVGHHVQHLLGAIRYVDSQRGKVSKKKQNELTKRLELQADFYSGVWAHYVQKKGLLEEGDVEEALRAANAVGDDRLQMQAQGYVVPDAFTHGTSEQRMRWFSKGLKTGDPSQGDTFRINARSL